MAVLVSCRIVNIGNATALDSLIPRKTAKVTLLTLYETNPHILRPYLRIREGLYYRETLTSLL
jgi:hypothetical protein